MQNYNTIIGVIKLRQQKIPYLTVQTRYSIGSSTVTLIMKRFKECGMTYQELCQQDPKKVEEIFFPKENLRRKNCPLPDFQDYFDRINAKGSKVNISYCWMEYKAENPDGYEETQFYELYKRFVEENYGSKAASMPVERIPGERMYIDWVGDKPEVLIDPDTGEIQKIHLFVTTLGISSYVYAEAFLDEKLPAFIQGTTNALGFYGAVPKYLVPDNLKTAVTSHTKDGLILNTTFQDLETFYNTIVLPPPKYKPKGKPTVENHVKTLETHLIERLKEKTYTSLEAVNSEIKKKELLLLAAVIVLSMNACGQKQGELEKAPNHNERLIEAGQNDETEAVEDQMIEPGTQEENPDTDAVIETYSFHFSNEDSTVDIYADQVPILTPEQENLDIYQVSLGDFSQELTSALFDYFFPDGEAYVFEGNPMTKSRLQEMLEGIQNDLEEIKMREDLSEADKELIISDFDEQIGSITRMMEDAPEESDVTKRKVTSQMEEVIGRTIEGDTVSYSLNVFSEDGNSKLSVLSTEGFYSAAQYFQNVTYSYLTDKDPEVADDHKTGDIITSDENTIGISKSDAISICDKFLAQIGLEAQLNDIAPAYRLETSENYRPYHPNRKISPDYQAYRLVYSRVFDNITIAATSSYDVPDDSMLDEHYKDWGYEHIVLYVNQNGIVNLQWDYPIAIGNPLSKNMKTISCKDAEAIFEQLMPKIEEENIRKYGNNLEGRITVQISKISLEYIRVRDGSDKTTGILTPAWVFYGESVEHLRGAEEEWENKKDTPEIVMAINAVDGTIIDIVRGY